MIILMPYKNGSKSVRELKIAGNGVEIKREGSKFVGRRGKKVVNWGCTHLPDEVARCTVLNSPEAVALAANKLHFFNAVKDRVSHVPFTDDVNVAEEWVRNGKTVVARTVLNGHSGQGIVLCDALPLPAAPLYTLYVPKKQEYRVHVIDGKVVDVQRKARRREVPDENVNWKIRNLDGGFIYARDFNEDDLPEDIKRNALATIKKLGLDFGAVDMIHNEKEGKSYVLEVNTAPGLQGQTLEAYVNAFKELGYIFEV